ncbi:unnamed protein product [Rotaria magnacalcarata]|uniref:LIM zinc-binding domain-containing protein n=2 Tax=Rotaria magnacalcarata TaxID=392030 RepID=A0A819IYI7_9BILA|nr:unnamed protein product [Rotaria magnacalcarata]CAF1652796.1 unnamed protein product [Rotaria magnacalcarata]CAF2077424.1 unnamed protein product [Rotaria magnacalcarata]CAF2237214.1 unnamed protein product [Rotaria magnacalcarata]CAF2263916.1 unnamed protein product [Rotaria magnacalcarata]
MSSRCAFCDKRFANGDRKSKYNDLEYHQRCFQCSTCHEPIAQSFYDLGNNEYRCSNCQTKSNDTVICIRCSQPITDESYIEYKDEPIHADCFTCYSCSEPLGSMLYVEHENQPYCISCHMRQFAQSCAVCGRAFPPGISTRRYENQYFHIECFRCFNCGKFILSKNYTVNSEQQRLCDQCN